MEKKKEATKQGASKETLAAAGGAAVVGAAGVIAADHVFGSDTATGTPGEIDEVEATLEPLSEGNVAVNSFQSAPNQVNNNLETNNLNQLLSGILQKANLLNTTLQKL